MGQHRTYFDTPDLFRVDKSHKPKEKLVRLYDQSKIFNDLFEIKAAKKAQAKKLHGLFFSIGLFISMALITLVVEWKTYESGAMVEVASLSVFQDELLEVPPTEQAPPEPVKKIQPNIVEVHDDEEIKEEITLDLDIDITDETKFEAPIAIEEEAPEEVAEEVFTIVENKPEPDGGMKGFYTYINENIKYPAKAMRAGIEGKVFVQFIVNTDGSLTDVEAVKGIGMGCDEEAIRVIQESKTWKPGKQRGKPVRVRMILPINFVLQKRGGA